MRRMLETRSHSWQQAGLALQVNARAARKARRQAAVMLPLLAGILLAYQYRHRLFGLDMPIRLITVIALVGLGWTLARDIGRATGPALFRRLDPGTAGTVGFLIRLVFMGVTLLAALNIAGLPPRTIAVGGAFTAVIFGLAAQQTLGNLIAGTVLLSARPFRVGDRVRMQGGGLAGTVEGVVSSLGLLYTTLASGEDSIMVPNSVVLSSAVTPLREPDSVDLRARLRADVRPSDLQGLLERSVTVDTRDEPRIFLEELDGDEVVVRVAATPRHPHEGPRLADEILAAVSAVTRGDGAMPGAANGASTRAGETPAGQAGDGDPQSGDSA
ncbi:MAG: small conductance mechanosensitive channel [Solirubrobacteraceae bacterium]|nr:small conductance mechanosensitive channel [Solirubrobacteraceae bacterium]